MTSRERWTVYPLLFLALGLALRAAVLAEPEQKLELARVVCRELLVTTADGTVLVHAGRVVGGGGGRIEIKDAAGIDAVAIGTGTGGRDGVVEFFDAAGEPVTR